MSSLIETEKEDSLSNGNDNNSEDHISHSGEETNHSKGDINSSNGNKRKLPSWMVSESAGSTKKTRSSDQSMHTVNSTIDTGNDDCDDKIEAHTSNSIVKQEMPMKQELNDEVPAEQNEQELGKVKTEPQGNGEEACSSSTGVIRIVKLATIVEKADATSSSVRESCKHGVRCYRRNPMHRAEQAHPGDLDYKRPIYPPPPLGVPDCPYGNCCYRRNPTHFQQFNHPADN